MRAAASASYPDDGHDTQTLLRSSEAAMQAAKRCRRTRISHVHASMIASSSERLSLKRDLRGAVAARDSSYCTTSRSFVRSICSSPGFEALVRWQHPDTRSVAAGSLHSARRRDGRDRRLGRLRASRRCAVNLVEWDARGVDVPRVCVNISARQFERTSLREAIIDNAAGVGHRAVAARAGADREFGHARHHRRYRDAARAQDARRPPLGR